MVKFETKLTGNLLSALEKLSAAAGESTLRSAGVAGAKVFQEEAKIRVPVSTGVIKNNIIIKRAEEKSNGAQKQTYLVTVRTGKKNAEGDAFYWRFVEFGTSKVAAQPFMRPAFEAMKRRALEAMRQRMREKIAELLSESK